MIEIGTEKYGVDRYADFAKTEHWSLLTEEQQSIWKAYLYRSEVYRISGVLVAIGAVGVSETGLTPVPPQRTIVPPILPVTISTAASVATSNPDPAAHIVPPSFLELQLAREAAEKAFRRNQSGRASSSSSTTLSAPPVILTSAEQQSAIARATANSDRFSGHGRAPHGHRASSSSAATLADDQRRSRDKAIEKELAKELQRKKNEAAAKAKK